MSFDFSRLRKSDQIIGGSAIAFFIFLFFFKWYGVSSNVKSFGGVNLGGSLSVSGWHAFSNSRWIWLITILVALATVAIAVGTLKFESPVQLSVVVAGLGALSTLLILYRIVHHPTASASYGSFHASAGIKIGIWLGLIAAAGVTYGGYLAMRDEGTSLADVREQASAAVGNMSSQPSPSTPASTPASTSSTSPTSTSTGPAAPAEPIAPPVPPPAEPPSGPANPEL